MEYATQTRGENDICLSAKSVKKSDKKYQYLPFKRLTGGG
jgi:hypothetical protein